MRKPTLSQIKRLNDRVETIAAWKQVLRIGGVIVQSPRLRDGTIQVQAGRTVYFLSPDQIEFVQAAFPQFGDGIETDLPINPNRKPMPDNLLTEFLALLERRSAEYTAPIATEERT